MDLQLGTAVSAGRITYAATVNSSPIRPRQSNQGIDGQDSLEKNICSMPLETLRTYAASCARKVNYFEIEVHRMREELQSREAQHARRDRQLHLTTSVRDEQVSKCLKQTELELAAERSIRRGLEVEQAKLRELCKKAKDRIGELVVHRSELEASNMSLSCKIEELNDQLSESVLVQEQLSRQLEEKQLEIDRHKFRGERLEYIVQHYDLHAQLRGFAGMINSVWQKIEQVKKNDSNLDQEQKDFTESPLVPTPDSYRQLLDSLSSQIPTIPVDLATIRTLPNIDTKNGDPMKCSLLSTSVGDTLRSLSSSIADDDWGIEEINCEHVNKQTIFDNQKEESFVQEMVKPCYKRLRSEESSVNVSEAPAEKRMTKENPGFTTKARRSKVGIRGKLQPLIFPKSAEELYPIPHLTPSVRKSSRLSSSIRKVHDELFREQINSTNKRKRKN